MAYLDFKNLNKTDSNFWKKKNDLATKKDEKNVMNKSENNINKQKILDISNGNKNKTSENNNQKQNEPKKKAGILDFLRAFKEMVAPFHFLLYLLCYNYFLFYFFLLNLYYYQIYLNFL